MTNRIAHLFADAPARGSLLSELLWAGASKAALVGELYLTTDPARHDAAVAVGAELAELARVVERQGATTDLAAASELAAATQAAILQAEAVLSPLAPRG